MDILIAGTGRCGTGYAAKLLTSVGVNCTHEQVFNPNGWDYALEQIRLRRANPQWGWRGESSWLATPYLQRPELYPMTVVHLVRHPQRVIESKLRLLFYTAPIFMPYFQWMRPHIPEIDGYVEPMDKAAYWYVKLNELAAARADVFHRVEDEPRDLLDKLGIGWQGMDLYGNTSYNSRAGFGPAKLDRGALEPRLRERLEEMAAEYGYLWPDD